MQPFTIETAVVAPLRRRDVDTDQIIPKQFLKRIDRTGFGECLFYDWRADPSLFLNDPRYTGAGFLVTGRNFGCGSSREHAAWALRDAGFRAILAPSFADIFAANCINNGIAPIVLEEAEVDELTRRALEGRHLLTIDLPAVTVRDEEGFSTRFKMDDFQKRRLLHGQDEIALTLESDRAITSFEGHVCTSHFLHER